MLRFALASTLICLVACPLPAKDEQKDKKKPGLNVKKLLGDWTYVSGARGGNEVAEERLAGTVKITKETFSLPGGPDTTFVMAYKIDAAKNPATIDFEIKEGPVPEGRAIGIIKMEKGRIVLCYDPTGAKRPTEFKSTADNGANLFVMKRKAQ